MSGRGPRACGAAETGDGDAVARTGTRTVVPGEAAKLIAIKVIGNNKKGPNKTFSVEPSAAP